MQIARRRGMKKAIVALARRLAVIMHRRVTDCSASSSNPMMEVLWGGGEDIASIVADVNRWSAPCGS